jgi:uncharacterized protein YjbJ (UPF0337 family)
VPGPPATGDTDVKEDLSMGDQDKLENVADEHLGKAKEAFGKASGDDDLKDEGKADQAKADLKQAGEKVKDAFS